MMMEQRKQREDGLDGYLTVFLSLILSVMISLCLVLVLGARENTRRLEIECVTDVGMNNILAEYHRELLKQYDLFFIDTSYGTATASYEQTAAHLKEYLELNLGGDEIFLSMLYRNLLKLQVDEVEITGVSAATDEDGAVLRRQAVDVMYGRVGAELLHQVQNWVTVTTEYELDTRDVLQEQKEASKALDAWNGTTVTVDGEETEVKIDNPGSKVVSFWEAGMLNLIVKEPDKLSGQETDLGACLSARQLLQGTGMNPAVTFEDGLWEQLLFHEYILAYTGRFTQEKEDSFLKYQTEYILAGKESDVENLKNVTYKLLAVRAASNMVYLISDQEKMKLAETVANVLAALITLPETAPLFEAVIVLTWALAESIYDVSQLLDGGRVPLLKSSADWHYSLEEMLAFQGDTEGTEQESGLYYEDYLRIMLCLQDKKVTTFRLMDIMEMDIRQTPGNRYFRMDGCIDSVAATIQYSGKDGNIYSITRNYGY
ncbi:MAG: DUF5702 domain-containing protein [Lachnospiraceae bacterium]